MKQKIKILLLVLGISGIVIFFVANYLPTNQTGAATIYLNSSSTNFNSVLVNVNNSLTNLNTALGGLITSPVPYASTTGVQGTLTFPIPVASTSLTAGSNLVLSTNTLSATTTPSFSTTTLSSLTISSIVGSVLATDATGKVIATSSISERCDIFLTKSISSSTNNLSFYGYSFPEPFPYNATITKLKAWHTQSGQSAYIYLTYGSDTSIILKNGTSTAESVYDGTRTAAVAADNDVNTSWNDSDNHFPTWWSYDLGTSSAKIASEVAWLGLSGGAIKNFTITASQNNFTISSTTLYNGIGANVSNTWQYFPFTNTTAYQYYRINITNVWSSTSIPITEIQFFATSTYPLSAATSTITSTTSTIITSFASSTPNLNDIIKLGFQGYASTTEFSVNVCYTSR